MKSKKLSIRSEVWLYPGMAGNWHFVSLSKKQSGEIKKKFHEKKRGWGSLPVAVTLGNTSWKTSIFPDTREGVYILPLKSEVRKKEGVYKGVVVILSLEIQA